MNRFCDEIQRKKTGLPKVQSLKKIKVAKFIYLFVESSKPNGTMHL